MPHSSDRLIRSMTAADSSSAFDGMQPRRRHVPPSRSVPLHDGHALAEQRGTQRGRVAAGAAAQNDQVVRSPSPISVLPVCDRPVR